MANQTDPSPVSITPQAIPVGPQNSANAPLNSGAAIRFNVNTSIPSTPTPLTRPNIPAPRGRR